MTDQAYLDISVGEQYLGRIVIGLFGEITPKTARNFKTIATDGINGKTYAGSRFHRVIKRFMIQGKLIMVIILETIKFLHSHSI